MLQDIPLAMKTCCTRVSGLVQQGGRELSHDREHDGPQRTSPELFHISVILLSVLAIVLIYFNLA